MSSIKNRMHIYRVGQPVEVREVEFKANPEGYEGPGYDQLRKLIEPLLDDAPLEHVRVLWSGRPADMFVDELGRLEMDSRPPLPRNDEATAIYRANWLKHHPEADPETLAWIAGTAIIFEKRVWF